MNLFLKYLIYAVAYLPLWISYRIADFLYYLQKYFIKYRQKVVLENLKNSFPEKTEKEIQILSNKFFRHLTSFFIESVKGLVLTQSDFDKRIEIRNLELINRIHKEEKSIFLLSGHIFNWEWLKGLVGHMPHDKIYAVYHAAHNKLSDEVIKKSRKNFGTIIIPMQEATQRLMEIPNDGKSLTLLIADQSPYKAAIRREIEFLNQETPVFVGFDKIARKKKFAVVYVDIFCPKRGHYIHEFKEISPEGEFFEDGEITNKFFSLLEENIKKDPANWLWSHRRWKYKKGRDY